MKIVGLSIKDLVIIVTAIASAILYFAPKADVKANATQIAMISSTQELAIYEERKGELENECLNRKTREWLCDESSRQKWIRYYRQIQILEKKLDIEHIEETVPILND